MDNHNSKSPPTTGSTSSPYESEPQELKNGGTAEVHMRRKKGRIYPDAQPTKNFQRFASPQPILGMPNTSIAGVVSNELSAITASPVPIDTDSDAIYNISADEELPPPPVELLDNTDDYPRIRFSYGSTDSDQNIHFDDFPPERETRHNLRVSVRRNDTGSSQSPPTSSLTEKSPSPPSSKSGSKHLRPVPPSDSEEESRPPQEDIKFRSIDFTKYKSAFRRGDSSTDADVCSDGDVQADIHTPLLQEGGGSPVKDKNSPPKKDSPGVPLLDGRESLDSKQRRSSSSGSRRGSQSSQRSRKNGKRNGKDPRGSSKSVKSTNTFEPIEHEDPWSLRMDAPPTRDTVRAPVPPVRDPNGRPPAIVQPPVVQPPVIQPPVRQNTVGSNGSGRDRRNNNQKLDPRDRFSDTRDSSLSTDSSMIRYPLSRQYCIESQSPASSVQRHEVKPTMGTQALKKDDSKERPILTPQGYPLAQYPPGHFPPPPVVPRPRDLPRPPQVRDFQTDTGEHTPDPLTTPESALGYRPHHARSQPKSIDRTGRTSPPLKSSVSVGDILFSDAVLPGSLSTGDLRVPRQQRQISHVRSVPRDLYAVPNKVANSQQQANRPWHQSQFSVDRVEVDTMPPPPSRENDKNANNKKRRFKHLRDRHYPICIAVSFATMLCINPPIGFIAVVFSYLSWKAYDRGDERTGFILARSALYTSLAGIIFTMTVIITTLYQTTIGF